MKPGEAVFTNTSALLEAGGHLANTMTATGAGETKLIAVHVSEMKRLLLHSHVGAVTLGERLGTAGGLR